MIGYLYIAVFSVFVFYDVIKNVYFFNKGEYNPYLYRKSKKDRPFIISLVISIALTVGISAFITSIKLFYIITVIFICYSFCLIVCESILNYLSYMRIKDRKIIIQTVIFDILVVSISTGIWEYVIQHIKSK